MGRTPGLILLGLLASFLTAGSAGAKILDTWTRISLQFTNLARAQASDTAIGVSTLSTSGSGMHLNTLSLGNATLPGLSLNTVLPVTDPLVTDAGVVSVRFTKVRPGNLAGVLNDIGVLGPISGAVQSTTTPPLEQGLGTVPSTGMVRICLLAVGCLQNLSVLVGQPISGVANGAGAGGILTVGQLGTIRISILGAPYTVKTVTDVHRTTNGVIATFTEKGFAHGPLSNTSSTGQTSGVLQLVTVTHVNTQGLPVLDGWGEFSRIVVHFVPEPGLLVLFGSGAVAMVVLGRRRS